MEDITIILNKEPYGWDEDIRKLCRYIAGESKNKKEITRYRCGEGVSIEPEKAAQQMISVQRLYKKARRRYGKKASRRIYHYVVSFPISMADANCAKLAAKDIAEIFCGQYQVYYGVHEDKKNLHIHYAINAVSCVDGKNWHKSKRELEELEAQMRERARKVLYC